ncbi:MAG: MarR family transcriptional regulator [Candidatus Heimdallarchaeota archaeon]|nr:MarR family transcriptional regulator [Candidatus Heimdallarchaeota archaeon]
MMRYKASPAVEQFKKNKEDEREERKDKIILFIKKNPGKSIYYISKEIGIPRTSLPKLLNELVDEEELKVVEENSGNTKRLKKAYYITTIDDFSYDNFIANNLKNKDFNKLTLKLMKSTLKNKGSFSLILPDEAVVKIKNYEDLKKKLLEYEIQIK